MVINPEKIDFEASYNEGKTQLVWDTLISDVHTPISASLVLKTDQDPFFY